MSQLSTSTLCALAALAFVAACVAHEAVGHGGACLALGGTIRVLSSSLFRCTPPRVLVDAAGPLTSLGTAAVAAGMVRVAGDGLRRTFFALLAALAGFWIAGELVGSAITDTDDLAFVLRALPLRPHGVARVAMGAVGAALYVAVLRRAGRDLPTGRPLVAAYLTAGVVACLSTACYRADLLPALREGALESLGASAGLLYVALRPPYPGRDAAARHTLRCSRPVIMLTVAVVALFWFTLGRGVIRG